MEWHVYVFRVDAKVLCHSSLTVSDADLIAMYTADYNSATTYSDPTRAGYVAVQETLLTERGIPIPSGNLTAAEIRAGYET